MPSEFDPYYKWLGIPPKDQPPHHYRLLGIEKFEPDMEVIDAAANRVMGYLQNLSVGEQAEISQRLLNEIAAARLCLLDSRKKSAYDERLRGKTDTPKTVPPVRKPRPSAAVNSEAADVPIAVATVVTTAPMPPAAPSAHIQSAKQPARVSGGSQQTDARRVRKRRNNTVLVVLLSVVFVALVGTGYYLIAGADDSAKSKTRRDRSAKSDGDTSSKAKDSKSKKSRKPGKQLPPLAEFDFNKKPIEPINDKPPAEIASWLEQADQDIRAGRISQAIGLLQRYLQYPGVPLRAQAQQWLMECDAAQIGERQAEHLISQLNREQVALLEKGQLTLRIENLEFTRERLEAEFYRCLRQHLIERKQRGKN